MSSRGSYRVSVQMASSGTAKCPETARYIPRTSGSTFHLNEQVSNLEVKPEEPDYVLEDIPVILHGSEHDGYRTVKVNIGKLTQVSEVIKKVEKEFKEHKRNSSDTESATTPGLVTGVSNASGLSNGISAPLEEFELHCVYFATVSHCFKIMRLSESHGTLLDQIGPIIDPHVVRSRHGTQEDHFDTVETLLQHNPSAASTVSSVAASGSLSPSSTLARSSTVFILYMTRKFEKLPVCDGNVMQTMVQQFSPSSLTLSSSDQYDLCALPELNEETLLYHIKGRYDKRKFCTYVGTILVSVNPYWSDETVNETAMMRTYERHSATTGTLSRGLEPHFFAVGDQAFLGMRESKQDQCIVISGESGSGKTWAANLIIKYLMNLANQGNPTTLENMILFTSGILEAFGNARTDHNDNSSRHGKYIQIQYKPGGIVTGARVQKYLLEKSRIVQHKINERNYHVFFYMLACDFDGGPDQSGHGQFAKLKVELNLTCAADYHYLNKSELTSDDSKDFEQFVDLVQCMHELLGASDNRYTDRQLKEGHLSLTVKNVFRVLAAILHLGNVQFSMPASDNLEKDVVQIDNEKHLVSFCELLRLPIEIVRKALQTRKHEGAAQFTKHNSVRDAQNARDTVAKSLYSSLFDWIIRQINFRLFSTSMAESSFYTPFSTGLYEERQIGILDIFGFEDLGKNNSFEQFCINFANEQLQGYFNDHIFNLEQYEYKSDGINWVDINYVNNKPCIDLFVKRPFCLFALIDEESSLYNGTNRKLLDKFEDLGKSKLPQSDYFIWRPVKRDPLSFGIKHYAGKVFYNISEFREKNLEKTNDLMKIMRYQTGCFFVKELCCQSPLGIACWRTVRNFFRAVSAFSNRAKEKALQNEKLMMAAGEDLASSAAVAKLKFRSKSFANPKLLMSQRSDSLDPDSVISYRGVHRDSYCPIASQESRHAKTMPEAFSQRKAIRHRKIREQPLRVVHWFWLQDPERLNLRKISRMNPSMSGSSLDLRSSKKDSDGASERWLTISSQFTGSLNQLMESLNRCKPSFIRCIRSNTSKVALQFDKDTVTRQLRYTGMLDTIRIRSSGYNVRLPLQSFIKEYRVLLSNGLNSTKADVQQLLSNIFPDPNSFQIGNSKVYLREKGHMQLQFFIELKLSTKVQMIQRWWRRILPDVLANRSARIIQRSYKKYKRRVRLDKERLERELRAAEEAALIDIKVSRSSTFTEFDQRKSHVDVDKHGNGAGDQNGKRSSPSKSKKEKRPSDSESPRKSSLSRLSVGLGMAAAVSAGGALGDTSDLIGKRRSVSPLDRSARPPPIQRRDRDPKTPGRQTTPEGSTKRPSITPQLLSSPSYTLCQKCHRRFPSSSDDGQVTVILCARCASPVVRKLSSGQEFDKLCRSVLPADKINKVLLKDLKEVNRFTQFLNANMKSLSGNETNDLARTLSSLKNDLTVQCAQSGRTFRPLKYLQLVKLFVDSYDKLAQHRHNQTTSVNSAGQDMEVLSKPYLVRTYVGLLTIFENNQKLEVDYIPKRMRGKRSARVREIKGHQLLEKPHSPQYTCPCQRRKIDDFVSCSLCSVTIHKMCEGLLTECKVAKVCEDFAPCKFIRVPLELLYKREDNHVPVKLEDLLNYIETYGLTREGIYRTNGSQQEKKRLIALLDSEAYTVDSLNDFDVRTAADVVKFFFRSLPDPVFTFAAYQRFIMAMDPEDREERIKIIFQHISKLPPAHYCTLQTIVLHLIRVSDHSDENKMNIANVATVFAENLMFTDTINIQAGGAAMLSTIQKKTQLLCLVLEKMSEKLQNNLRFLEDLDDTLAVIDKKLMNAQLAEASGEYPHITNSSGSSATEDTQPKERLCSSMNLDLESNGTSDLLSLDVKSDMFWSKWGTMQTIVENSQLRDPDDDLRIPVEHNDPKVLLEQKKVLEKIRERILQEMPRLTYEMADTIVPSVNDYNEYDLDSERKSTVRSGGRSRNADMEEMDNNRLTRSNSVSSDIAEEVSAKLSWRVSEGEQSATGRMNDRESILAAFLPNKLFQQWLQADFYKPKTPRL